MGGAGLKREKGEMRWEGVLLLSTSILRGIRVIIDLLALRKDAKIVFCMQIVMWKNKLPFFPEKGGRGTKICISNVLPAVPRKWFGSADCYTK